jgi:hypothetical protein
MRISGVLVACAAVMLCSSSAPAQQTNAARDRLAVRICAADISAKCAGVQGGHGGLRACVKEHLKDFSESCQASLAKLAAIRQACSADIKQNCPATSGPRRVQACLKAALANLGDACKEALAQAIARAPR